MIFFLYKKKKKKTKNISFTKARFLVDYEEVHPNKLIHDKSSLMALDYEWWISNANRGHASLVKTRLIWSNVDRYRDLFVV
jgi:hypothetical protein